MANDEQILLYSLELEDDRFEADCEAQLNGKVERKVISPLRSWYDSARGARCA